MSDRIAGQALRAVEDLAQVVVAPVRVDIGAQRQPGQPEQAVERGADLVAGVGEERALGLARRLGGIARRRQRLVEAAPLGDVVGDPDRAAGLGLRAVDRLREQAAPEHAAVLAPHRALELELLAGRQQRAGQCGRSRRSRLRWARPRRRTRRRSAPASQPNMRSKSGFACTKRRSRVKAMPIEARSRIAACSSRVRSVSVTSRALITR